MMTSKEKALLNVIRSVYKTKEPQHVYSGDDSEIITRLIQSGKLAKEAFIITEIGNAPSVCIQKSNIKPIGSVLIRFLNNEKIKAFIDVFSKIKQ